MDDFKPELLRALLEWVSPSFPTPTPLLTPQINTFELPSKITQWSQLEDGQVLWQILQDVDTDYFYGELPERDRKSTDSWIPRWQNCMINKTKIGGHN